MLVAHTSVIFIFLQRLRPCHCSTDNFIMGSACNKIVQAIVISLHPNIISTEVYISGLRQSLHMYICLVQRPSAPPYYEGSILLPPPVSPYYGDNIILPPSI